MASKRSISLGRIRAFSLIEMLAVLTILAILLALGVPAVKSMIYSSERSLAENQLRVAMTAARDAAVRSGGGDAAAVFFYQDGRTLIVPCVSVGTIWDRVIQGGADTGTSLDREVFVPVAGVEPVRMPKGWNVRGYAAPGVIATGTAAVDNPYGWLDCVASMPLSVSADGHWVFPETNFVNMNGLNGTSTPGYNEGWKRQTFMVRFEAGTGNAVLSAREPVVVVDPLPVLSGDGFRAAAPYDLPEHDPTQAATLETFVRQLISTPQLRSGNPPVVTRLIGDASPDTVLAMPLTELALCDEQRLASAIGAARLNPTTQCLYGDPANINLAPIEPTLDTSVRVWGGTITPEEILKRIDAYMTLNVSGDLPDDSVPLEARVFTVQRYMGQLQEVSPEVEQ